MKQYFFLFALLLMGFVATAQNSGNQGSFVISEAKLIPSGGIADEIEIRLSGPAANVWSYMEAVPTYTTRLASISFTKVGSTDMGQGNGNGNTSVWRATVDGSSITDPVTGDIELTVDGGPFCCRIPQGGIVVKIKGR